MTKQQLKSARAKLGLTQEKLASALGVATNTVKRWEMGRHPIPPWAVKFISMLQAQTTKK